VIFVALAVVIAAANFVTAREFDVYVTRNAEAWSRRMIRCWKSYEKMDWQEADAILGSTVVQGGPGMMGGEGHGGMMGGGRGGSADDDDMWVMMGLRFVVADARGVVVADTAGTLEGEAMGGDVLAQGDPIISEGQQIGTLVAIRPGEDDASRASFLFGVSRAVTLAALAAGLFALLLGTLLSRRITQPLRQLQEAAGTIAAGNLEARVPVTSGDELGSVANAFNQMAGRLGEQQALRKQMVADIAHELRTPISIMQGTLEAMIDGVLPASAEELRDLHGDIRRLARLVEDLRTLSLAEAGQLTLLRGAVDIPALARRRGADVTARRRAECLARIQWRRGQRR
jgi:two-component system OmpR family sensor kinase/two-component system sensor histidine kinase BaeS